MQVRTEFEILSYLRKGYYKNETVTMFHTAHVVLGHIYQKKLLNVKKQKQNLKTMNKLQEISS